MLMAKEISPVVKTNARRASSSALPLNRMAPTSVAEVLEGTRFFAGAPGTVGGMGDTRASRSPRDGGRSSGDGLPSPTALPS